MMPKHELVDVERPGRRSGIRRLMYRPVPERPDAKSGAAKTGWRDTRDWSSIKDQLRLTVRRAPEVVINVKGSRRTSDDDHAAIQGVLRYMMYISRNGRLLSLNEFGERIEGSEHIRETHAAWDLDMQRMRGPKDETLHPSFNLIFSMPAETDPAGLLDAVAAVARERFVGHQYLMAVHTQQTDPADDPPAHPHVHLILRAENEDGHRIHIRKGDLRTWREQFAKELRARGIEANATSRAERGKSLKSIKGAEWHIQKRYERNRLSEEPALAPKARMARFMEAARELQEGHVQAKPWEIAMAARRREVVRDLNHKIVLLRNEGEHTLADEVAQFVRDMPPLDSERLKMQRAMVKSIDERLHERAKERDSS